MDREELKGSFGPETNVALAGPLTLRFAAAAGICRIRQPAQLTIYFLSSCPT
jgi:hypothetical protein